MVCSRYPKECRYYETVLKRKCFKKLKDNVWERKTKWILLEQADFHYRLKLLNKHFNFWIVFLNESFKKKINNRAAEVFQEEKLKLKGLIALKRNVEQVRIFMRICRRKFEWNLEHKCWHQWKHYTQKRVKVREIKLLADRIREERLRVRCFYLWSFRLREKRSAEHACKKAEAMHKIKMEEKYFNSWKVFTERKVCKRRIEKLAKCCYEDKLKEKFIKCWKRYILQKKRYKYQMKVIHRFYESYLIKNYLSRCMFAYEKLKLDRKIRNRDLAEGFYNRKLLEKSFNILCRNREEAKEKEEKVEKFREISAKVYLEFYLNLWLEKRRRKMVSDILEKKAKQWREEYLREYFLTKMLKKYEERQEEKEDLANVVKYSNAVIVHRAFRGWIEVTERKINKRFEIESANGFYLEKLARKTFDKWKKFKSMKNRKKMAVEYHRTVTLSRVVSDWRIFLSEEKKKHAEAKNLEERICAKLVRSAFDCWRNEINSFHSKRTAAEGFHEKSLLSRAFNTWKANSRIKAAQRNRYNRNRIALNGIIVKNALLRWHEMHSVKLCLKRKMEGFRRDADKRSLLCHFTTWRQFVEKMNTLREKAGSFAEMKSAILIEDGLAALLGAGKEKKMMKRKHELARRAEEKMLKRKYLRKWLSFICWRKERILKFMAEEQKNTSRKAFEFCIPAGKATRRQPVIPDFLKINLSTDLFEESTTQETFRVEQPVNKKLPVLGQADTFVSFET